MKCPKCNKRRLTINGTFDGTQEIQFKSDGEDFVVIDSEPTDFSWDDHDLAQCSGCGHIDSVVNFREEEEEDAA